MHSVLAFLLFYILVISSKAAFNVTSSLSLSLSSDPVSGVLFKLPEAADPPDNRCLITHLP